MAEPNRLAAALSYEQDRPAFGNPSMLEQGRKMRERKQTEQVERSAQRVKGDLLARALMRRYNPETLTGLTDTPGPQTLDEAAGLDPRVDRSTFLPYSQKEGLHVPAVAADLMKLATASNPQYSNLMQPEEAMPLATNMMGGGVVASRLAPAPAGSLGMFIGKTAKNWNAAAEAKALEMEKAGANPQAIWQETGTWKGPDAAWRQEIPDNIMEIKNLSGLNASDRASIANRRQQLINEVKAQGGKPTNEQKFRMHNIDNESVGNSFRGKISDVLKHEPLDAAYPSQANTKFNWMEMPTDIKGEFSPENGIALSMGIFGDEAKSTVLHELQHSIQNKEGFARGGNTNEFASGPMFDKRARDLTADLSQVITGGVSAKPIEVLQGIKYADPANIEPIVKKYGFKNIEEAKSFIYDENERRTPLGQYLRLAGEAEARATQARRNMTAEERRAKFPAESYDVPIDQLIIRQ